MPQISSFYGIVIAMYFLDHGQPHFHAEHAEHSAKVAISTGEIYEGCVAGTRRATRTPVGVAASR